MRSRRLGSIAVLALMLASLAFGAIAPATAAEPGWLSGAIEQGLAAARDGVRCDASQTLTVEGGRAVRSSILDKMDGFARASETTGGLGQRVLVVRSLDDDRLRDGSGPPGSLREAVWLAKQAGGGWIVFSDDLPSERRINLVSGLVLPSNVTIDGGCRGFTVSSDHGASVLTMRNVANVVVMRLHIEQRAPFVHGSGDCVNGNGADRVWVAFNVLRRCEDGLVDIGVRNYKPDRPVRATVAYNLFEDHEKDMLLATYDCQADHVGCDNQLGIAWMWNGGVQVTVQGNLFDRTSERHPRLSGQSYAHLVDNVIAFAAVERSPGVFGATYGSFTGDRKSVV